MAVSPASPATGAARRHAREPLRIAMLAPPWIPVPPRGYGGIEAVVATLTRALRGLGHEVVLYAAPGSGDGGRVHVTLEEPHPREIGQARWEADHVAASLEHIEAAGEAGRPFDIIHDHCGHCALTIADRLDVPLLHTVHSPFPESGGFYARHGARAPLVTLSRAQATEAPPEAWVAATIPNPVDAAGTRACDGRDGPLVWLGRFSPAKGAHEAIDVARAAGLPLVLAGVVQPGQEHYFATEIEPRLGGSVRFAGEVAGAAKDRLLAGARALLMPIRWTEPFGMVMIEAMAWGTPVIAYPAGAVPEVVEDGLSGLLVEDAASMARATREIRALDPVAVRRSALSRFDARKVARRYVAAYHRAVATAIAPGRGEGAWSAGSAS